MPRRARTFGVLIGFVALSLVPAMAGAEEAEGHLSLSALIAEALAHNPTLQSYRYRSRAARETIRQEASLPDPQLTVTEWEVPSNFNLATPGQRWFGLGQTFPFPGKRRTRSDVAEKAAAAVDDSYHTKELDVRAEVTTTFYVLFRIDRLILLHREHERLLESFVRIALERYRVGQAPQQDSLKAQVEMSQLHGGLVLLEEERAVAVANLNRLVGRPIENPVAEIAPVVYLPVNVDLDALSASARERRPDLIEAGHQLERSDRAVELARLEARPDFSVELTYVDVRDGANEWMAVARMNLPWIFGGKYAARQQQARAERAAAESEQRATRERAMMEVRNAYTRFRNAEHLYSIYTTGIVPQAEQNVDAARIAYQTGRTSFLDLIDAERRLRDIQMEAVMHLAVYWQQAAELERTSGVNLTLP